MNAHAFYAADLVLSVFSSLVAFFIAGYALRGYLLMKNRTGLFFSSAFLLISGGLLSRVVFDHLVRFELTYNPRFAMLQTMTSLQAFMLFLSIFLLTSGYVLLLILFFKINSKRITVLLISLVALLALSTSNAYLTAHVLPAIFLFFALTHTIENFYRKRNTNRFLVCASFLILFASELFFLLILKSISFYFVGTILRMVAYLLLLANTLLVLRK